MAVFFISQDELLIKIMEKEILEEGLIGDFLSDLKYKSSKDYRAKQADKFTSVKESKIKTLEDLLSVTEMLNSIDNGKFILYCSHDLDIQLTSLKYRLNNLNAYDKKQLKSIINMLNSGLYDKFMDLCSGEVYDKYVSNPEPIKLSTFLSHYIDHENGKVAEPVSQPEPPVVKDDPAEEKVSIRDLPITKAYQDILFTMTNNPLLQQQSSTKVNQVLINFFSGTLDTSDPVFEIFKTSCDTLRMDTNEAFKFIKTIMTNVLSDKEVLFNPDFINSIFVKDDQELELFDFNYYISCFRLRELLDDVSFTNPKVSDCLDLVRLYTRNFDARLVTNASDSKQDNIRNSVDNELKQIMPLLVSTDDKNNMRLILKYLRRCNFCD